MINMPFSLLDRFRSRLQRNKNWKLSNKVHKYQTPVQRSSQESDDSEFTQVTKTSFDTVASLASISTISTSVSTHSIPIPSATDINALQTNDLPSSKEVTEIHTILDAKRRKTFELERRKEVLDRQRKFLDRQLHLLDEELGEMTEDVVKYKGVVGCSMRNIPSDLLLEIFQHYVAESDCTSSLGSATTLTHVCRTWRQIALSCPALWITLTASHINERVATNVLERLNQVRAVTGIPLEWYTLGPFHSSCSAGTAKYTAQASFITRARFVNVTPIASRVFDYRSPYYYSRCSSSHPWKRCTKSEGLSRSDRWPCQSRFR
ncbi:hypothetical protein EV361DRAFT_205891 [Lentinula raphanica]|nr:hypothetical protein EV361DRAFT_205891 [Lentinula raphanica]